MLATLMPRVLPRATYFARKLTEAATTAIVIRSLHKRLWSGPFELPPSKDARALQARHYRLLHEDFENAERGVYPRALLWTSPWLGAWREAPRTWWEVSRIVARAKRGGWGELPAEANDARYPAYYRRTFHWQTDGWFSERSARLYDPGVELLFGGTADARRRAVLPELLRALADVPSPRILDVAMGTGRFLGQLHACLPDARLHGLDLSPAYVDHARRALAHVPSLTLLCENAETMSLPDASLHAASCIFTFHELPLGARRRVVAEVHRMLRPGGVFALVDAAQADDGAEIFWFLERFPSVYHEPYFKGYLREPLPSLMQDAGFELLLDRPAFVSRVVLGRKPAR